MLSPVSANLVRRSGLLGIKLGGAGFKHSLPRTSFGLHCQGYSGDSSRFLLQILVKAHNLYCKWELLPAASPSVVPRLAADAL